MCAELTTFVPGRRLDDDVQILLRYRNGAKGLLWVSQVAPGHENGLKIRVYGSKGGLEWVQAEPNELLWSPLGQNRQIITRNGAGAGPASNAGESRAGRPSGEGYLEGFANLYSEVAEGDRRRTKRPAAAARGCVPGPCRTGVKGLAFIEAAIRSSAAGGVWTTL